MFKIIHQSVYSTVHLYLYPPSQGLDLTTPGDSSVHLENLESRPSGSSRGLTSRDLLQKNGEKLTCLNGQAYGGQADGKGCYINLWYVNGYIII